MEAIGLLIQSATEAIAGLTGIELEVSEATWGGMRANGFRPAGLEHGEGFTIALSHSLVRAEAFFVADRFSGPLLRTIGESIAAEPQSWLALIEAAELEDLHSAVVVNNEPIHDFSDVPTDPWRNLEIEVHARVAGGCGGTQEMRRGLTEVGAHCLALILSGLETEPSFVHDSEPLPEGTKTTIEVNKYERSPVNRMRCILFYGANCWVCDLDFASTYGEIGSGFIEVHHRVPVSELGDNYLVDPVKDLIPLCSNCHSMVHRRVPPFQPDELREILGRPTKPLPR